MAQIYHIISIAAFSVAGVSLVLAVIFWFKFDIWKIIGELSGRTARKTIAQMRLENEQNAVKILSGDLRMSADRTEILQSETGVLLDKTEILSDETEILSDRTEILSDETEVLSDGTEVLSGKTQVLQGGMGVLTGTMENDTHSGIEGFEIIQNMVLIHTAEVI